MGFVAETVFRLVFEDPALEGLEVRIRDMSIGDALDLIDLTTGMGSDREKTGRALELVSAALVDWNVERADGTPVPTTVDGLRTQRASLLGAIVREWLQAALGVSRPLEPASNGGGQSEELSLPMEPLSASPSS